MRAISVASSSLVLTLGLALPAFAESAAKEAAAPEKAIAVIHPASGSEVKGVVTFTKQGDAVQVSAQLEGLKPGRHGFHVHQFGDCSADDAASAGPHFSSDESHPHGAPSDKERHVGDLGNITATDQGKASSEATDKHLALSGENSIIGRAVIVHADPDDLKSQPSGNAGARIGCGVIGVAKK